MIERPRSVARPKLIAWLALSAALLLVACGGPSGSGRPQVGAPLAAGARADAARRSAGISIVQIGQGAPVTRSEQPNPAVLTDVSRLPRWNRGERLTLLLLGIDRRASEIARSDSIILATIELRNRRAAAVSIPRDLLVEIPGVGTDRVNAAFAFGELEQAGSGPLHAKQTLERNFQVAIDHWVAVDFQCFRGAVDAIGGIQLNVPRRVTDGAYPTDDWGYQAISFEPGLQWLDGERALQYARTRHADSDFGRMRRQQQVLAALRAQLLTVQNITALPTILQSCQGLRSDLSPLELVALAFAGRTIPEDRIQLRVIDESMTQATQTAGGASVLAPRWEAIRPLIKETLPPVTARP